MPDEGTQQTPVRRVVPQPIEDEMQRSYIDYAVSVIVSRAIPDARDGLKPLPILLQFEQTALQGPGSQTGIGLCRMRRDHL